MLLGSGVGERAASPRRTNVRHHVTGYTFRSAAPAAACVLVADHSLTGYTSSSRWATAALVLVADHSLTGYTQDGLTEVVDIVLVADHSLTGYTVAERHLHERHGFGGRPFPDWLHFWRPWCATSTRFGGRPFPDWLH